MRDEVRSNLKTRDAESADYQRQHATQPNRWDRLGWGVWDVAEDGAFDLVFADHGAPSFTDPRITIPEAARVPRPGGRLVSNLSTPILRLCQPLHEGPPCRGLERPYFEAGRAAPTGPGASERTLLTYGEWIRLFASSGLVIDDLIELRPPADRASADTSYPDYVPWDWARDFPAEHISKTHKSGSRRTTGG